MAATPRWLIEFVDRVAAEAMSLRAAGELGCHVFHNTGHGCSEWEVTLFPDSMDESGHVRLPWLFVYSIDVAAVLSHFEIVTSCRWQTECFGDDDDLGAHLSVEGSYAGQAIWLRILSVQPRTLTGQQPRPRPLV